MDDVNRGGWKIEGTGLEERGIEMRCRDLVDREPTEDQRHACIGAEKLSPDILECVGFRERHCIIKRELVKVPIGVLEEVLRYLQQPADLDCNLQLLLHFPQQRVA